MAILSPTITFLIFTESGGLRQPGRAAAFVETLAPSRIISHLSPGFWGTPSHKSLVMLVYLCSPCHFYFLDSGVPIISTRFSDWGMGMGSVQVWARRRLRT